MSERVGGGDDAGVSADRESVDGPGRFLLEDDMENDRTVCVLGASVAEQLFSTRSPIGQSITVGGKVFQVVGTTKAVGLAGGKVSALTGRDLNFDVYFPLTTNAALFSDRIAKFTAGDARDKSIELTEIYLRADSAAAVEPAAATLQRLMDVLHEEKSDVKLFVPRELLNQANQAALMFNLVMGGIAVLSLLIGGIGIMNISLATVTERTCEIGIRRALGGKRRHIVSQFLIETTTLSLAGGVLGIWRGGAAVAIEFLAADAFPTAVTPWSVALSFSISVMVGIVFGVYPAYVAAQHKDPDRGAAAMIQGGEFSRRRHGGRGLGNVEWWRESRVEMEIRNSIALPAPAIRLNYVSSNFGKPDYPLRSSHGFVWQEDFVCRLWGVAQCTLPILEKLVKVPLKNITVMDFEDRREILAPWIKKGVTFVRDRVERHNMGELLGKYLAAGDLLIDLAWNIDCCELCSGATMRACCTSTPRWRCGIPMRARPTSIRQRGRCTTGT